MPNFGVDAVLSWSTPMLSAVKDNGHPKIEGAGMTQRDIERALEDWLGATRAPPPETPAPGLRQRLRTWLSALSDTDFRRWLTARARRRA